MNKLCLIVFLFSAAFCCAQKDSADIPRVAPDLGSWTQHHVVFSIGIGNYNTDPYKYYNTAAAGNSTITQLSSLIIHIKGDFAYNEHFGFGLSISQSRLNYHSEFFSTPYATPPALAKENVSLKIFVVNFRLNYHPFHAKIFDPYVGIGAGIRTYNYSGTRNPEKAFLTKLPFGFELTAGIRYLVASRVGVYAEAGNAASKYQVGISVNVGKLRKF